MVGRQSYMLRTEHTLRGVVVRVRPSAVVNGVVYLTRRQELAARRRGRITGERFNRAVRNFEFFSVVVR